MSLIAIKAQSRILEQTELDDRQVALVVRERIGDQAKDLGSDAQSAWPTKTGVSAAGLEWGVEATSGGGVRAFVEDMVWYSGYVSISAGNAWLRLVVEPADNDEDEFVAELADAVAVALVGGN